MVFLEITCPCSCTNTHTHEAKAKPKLKSRRRKPFTNLLQQKKATAARPTNIRGTKTAA